MQQGFALPGLATGESDSSESDDDDNGGFEELHDCLWEIMDDMLVG